MERKTGLRASHRRDHLGLKATYGAVEAVAQTTVYAMDSRRRRYTRSALQNGIAESKRNAIGFRNYKTCGMAI